MTQQPGHVGPETPAWDAGKQSIQAATGIEDVGSVPEGDTEDEEQPTETAPAD